MTHLHKLRTLSILKWVSSNFVDSLETPQCPMRSLFCIAKNCRFYGIKRIVRNENCDNVAKASLDNGQRAANFSRATRRGAQAALLEYLYLTRNIPFVDAQDMSLNSPHFIGKLLQKVDTETDVCGSIARFLRYHPINEFEPFFESLGLKPYEYAPLLPRDLMFIKDDDLLLDNFHVLYNYGIPRNKIGRIYKEATQVFRYDHGVVGLKLRAYEQLGLSQSFIRKAVACSPYLLIGNVNIDFVKVLEILRKGGIESSWIEEQLLENRYHWSQILSLLNLFSKIGYSNEQLGGMISQHPGILFEGSGYKTLFLIGFLFKFGSSMNQICSVFLHFSHRQIGKFVSNLRQSYLFLTEIEMDMNEIEKIICSHPLLLGSCTLKKTSTILGSLNVGKKKLCKIIQENPQEMAKWVMGSRIERIPNSGEESRMLKIKFLLDMGLVENPNEMENALKVYRGQGTELQERFECIVKAGLNKKDVCEMIRLSPQILNQTKEVIENKIDFLVNGLGYPASCLVNFPSYLSYTRQRVELRLAMYNWLKEQGTFDSLHALSTIIACTENFFVRNYVQQHPGGLEMWLILKEEHCS